MLIYSRSSPWKFFGFAFGDGYVSRVDNSVWAILKSLGIANTTSRGSKSGARKQRLIPSIMGYGRYSYGGNYAVDSNSALTFKNQVI